MNGESRPQGPAVDGVGTHRNHTGGMVRPSTIPAIGDAETIATNVIEAVGPVVAVKVARTVLDLVQSIGRPVQVSQKDPPGQVAVIPAGKIRGVDGKVYPRSSSSAADRRRQVAAYLVAHPEASDRSVARAVGVSPSTVAPIRVRVLVESIGRVIR